MANILNKNQISQNASLSSSEQWKAIPPFPPHLDFVLDLVHFVAQEAGEAGNTEEISSWNAHTSTASISHVAREGPVSSHPGHHPP